MSIVVAFDVCECALRQYGDLYWKLLRGREGSAAARSQTIPDGEFFCTRRTDNGACVGGSQPVGAQQILTPATT